MTVNVYTGWPTVFDISARLDSVGVMPRGDVDAVALRVSEITAAVTAEVAHLTRRQFVADTIDTTRIFDGNGTAELEVDPIVSLTSIQLAGGYGTPTYLYDLASVQITRELGKPATRLTVGRGSLPAYATAAVLTPVYYLFPTGRQNVQVTGKWGYGPTIPIDLWEAVCGEVALRLTREALFTINGRVTDEQFGDQRRKLEIPQAEATGWHKAYQTALIDYKRPAGAALRKRTRTMI